MNQSVRQTASLLVLVATSGCGGTQPGASPSEAQAPSGPINWEAMSVEARGQYMADVVVPAMAPLFREYDPTRFADVRCPTCHGENPRARGFQMPSAEELDPAHMPDPASSNADEARAARFMFDVVKPRMAELLGLPQYDPATQQGFGCFHCHRMAGH